jgi:hypothetical protein
MMVNTDIIHLCTSKNRVSNGESIKLPEEVHHIIMLPIDSQGRVRRETRWRLDQMKATFRLYEREEKL